MVSSARRPYVICHMVCSVGGRIQVTAWPKVPEMRATYERLHGALGGGSWMCGRITMQAFADGVRDRVRESHSGGEHSDENRAVGMAQSSPHEDYLAPEIARGVQDGTARLAIVVDAQARLEWRRAEIDGDAILVLLTGQVADIRLAEFRAAGVSYLVAGHESLDLSLAMQKLAALGVDRVLLEGGGHINGAMLAAGLVDELSVLVAPVVDATVGAPTLADIAAPHDVSALELLAAEPQPGGLVWLRYRVQQQAPPIEPAS